MHVLYNLLISIVFSVCGPNTESEWAREGRRIIPLLRRADPVTAFTARADAAKQQASYSYIFLVLLNYFLQNVLLICNVLFAGREEELDNAAGAGEDVEESGRKEAILNREIFQVRTSSLQNTHQSMKMRNRLSLFSLMQSVGQH